MKAIVLKRDIEINNFYQQREIFKKCDTVFDAKIYCNSAKKSDILLGKDPEFAQNQYSILTKRDFKMNYLGISRDFLQENEICKFFGINK